MSNILLAIIHLQYLKLYHLYYPLCSMHLFIPFAYFYNHGKSEKEKNRVDFYLLIAKNKTLSYL